MTTPDAPRHLPPTPEERARTIANRMAGGSAEGLTLNARPVQPAPRGSDSGVGTVITGESVENAVSITNTSDGDGSSQSLGYGTIAIGPDSYAIGGPDPTNLGAIAIGVESHAAADEGIAIGGTAHASATDPGWGPVALGGGAAVYGDGSVAVGRGATVGSVGAEVGGATAIGTGAHCTVAGGTVIAGSALGFYGATPVAKAAAPTTLADVITILQNLGLCS